MRKDCWKNNNLLKEASSSSYESLGNAYEIEEVLPEYFKRFRHPNPFTAENIRRFRTCNYYELADNMAEEELSKSHFPFLNKEDFEDIEENYEKFTPEFVEAFMNLVYRKARGKYHSEGEVILKNYHIYIDWEGIEDFLVNNDEIDAYEDKDGTIYVRG